MKGSHPPTLITLARRVLSESPRPSVILAAVSGGPDSMALLHVLAFLRGKLGFSLHAHGVDHGLRDDAARELDRAADYARSLEVPWGQTLTKVAPGGNLQARARTQRFVALRAAASTAGATLIATGHHADDRAETVLIRLLRGTSPRGLAVLPSRSEDLIRPFLRARRSDILAHIGRHQIPYSSDPSNASPRFVRTRVRHELLPLMEQLSPSIVSHLCRLADDLDRDPPRSSGLRPPELARFHGRARGAARPSRTPRGK